ncbi:MAG: outer membrane lipoprotein carrier protein LolA [Bacteroidota bacterium]
MKTFFSTLTALSALLLILSGFGPVGPADNILQDSKEKLESLNDLAADFTYSISSPAIKNPIAKKGAFKYKDGMYVVEMSEQDIYCDSKTLWIHLKDEEAPEVTIMDYDPEEGMNIEAIFKLYEASAQSLLEGEETIHGVACHKIKLAIKDSKLEYNQARLWVNKKTKLLEKVSVTNRRQSTTTYEFSGIKTNSGFNTTTFQFDVSRFPGIDVYDER